MTDELDTLIAKQAITEVLYRYCHAVDRIDPELAAQVWHEDGLAHYDGIFEGTAAGFFDFVFEAHSHCDATSHQLTNILIEVDGDSAVSQSYVTACLRTAGLDRIVRGRYLDRLSCRAGKWRIDERRYVNDISQTVPAEEPGSPHR